MIKHREFVAIPLALLLAACAGSRRGVEPVAHDSGAAPSTFDLVVVRKSASRYEVAGDPYTFDSLVERVRREKARTVLVEGANTVADVLCVSILGVETGRAVFFKDGNGKAKAVSFAMDASSTQSIARSCRE